MMLTLVGVHSDRRLHDLISRSRMEEDSWCWFMNSKTVLILLHDFVMHEMLEVNKISWRSFRIFVLIQEFESRDSRGGLFDVWFRMAGEKILSFYSSGDVLNARTWDSLFGSLLWVFWNKMWRRFDILVFSWSMFCVTEPGMSLRVSVCVCVTSFHNNHLRRRERENCYHQIV